MFLGRRAFKLEVFSKGKINEEKTVSIVNIANVISIFRVFLIPFFFYSCFVHFRNGENLPYVFSLILLFLIAISDGLDGFVARRFKMCTPLGALIDPLADKLFITTAFILFSAFNQIPIWLAVVQISKELIVLFGWVIMFALEYDASVEPSLLGKISAVLQLIVITGVLLYFPDIVNYWISIGSAILTVMAGFGYIWTGLERARIKEEAKRTKNE